MDFNANCTYISENTQAALDMKVRLLVQRRHLLSQIALNIYDPDSTKELKEELTRVDHKLGLVGNIIRTGTDSRNNFNAQKEFVETLLEYEPDYVQYFKVY